MKLPPADLESHRTRQRLLDAAGEVFAEHGFRAATVRDICQRAGANIAAVNYHFGDKQRLYAEVLRYAHQCAIEAYPPDIPAGKTIAPEQKLHAFIRSFMLRVLDKGRPAWHGKLSAREMMAPTESLDQLVQEEIRPRAILLESIVKELLGSKADQRLIRNCARSVIGQCLFYHHAQPVITRLHPEQGFEPKDIEQLADHIAQFSLAAIKSIARGGKGATR